MTEDGPFPSRPSPDRGGEGGEGPPSSVPTMGKGVILKKKNRLACEYPII